MLNNVIVASAGLAGVAALDVVTGSEVSFSLFYLAPIGWFTWQVGLLGGLAASVAGALTWYAMDDLGGGAYSHPLIPVWNSLVRLGFFVLVSVLLVALRQSIAAESALARTDPLTGLLNRRGFEEVTAREIARAARLGSPLTLAYIDLDDFKAINDTHGHAAGDRVLHTTARVMDLVLRGIDVTGRIGGDEFVLAMPDTDAEAATTTLERLSGVLGASGVEASIGAMVYVNAPIGLPEALAAVDAVMYQVKGNRFRRVAVEVSSPAHRPPGRTDDDPVHPAA